MPPQNPTPQPPIENLPPSSPEHSPQPQGAVIGGNFLPPNEEPKPPKKSMGKLVIFISLLLLSVISAVFVGYYFFMIPARQAKEFTAAIGPIHKDLKSEMDKLYNDNFITTKNKTTDYDKAKKLLATHTKDLDQTRNKVDELEGKYEALKPTKHNEKEKEQMDIAFNVAERIIKTYQTSLNFRKLTFDAYGELPNELNNHVQQLSKGGLRLDFVAQADAIADMAANAQTKLKYIDIGQDDSEQYELRIEYLKVIESTFTKLSEYYRTVQDDKVATLLSEFSKGNVEFNKKVDAALVKYVEESSISTDFNIFNEISIEQT